MRRLFHRACGSRAAHLWVTKSGRAFEFFSYWKHWRRSLYYVWKTVRAWRIPLLEIKKVTGSIYDFLIVVQSKRYFFWTDIKLMDNLGNTHIIPDVTFVIVESEELVDFRIRKWLNIAWRWSLHGYESAPRNGLTRVCAPGFSFRTAAACTYHN